VRKFVLIIIVALTTLKADPFNTLSGYTLARGEGFIGPILTCSLPLKGEEQMLFYPALLASLGFSEKLDATMMLDASTISGEFRLGHVMFEGKYSIVESDNLAISPLLNLYVPMDNNKFWAIAPGLAASGNLSFFSIHANLFYHLEFSTPASRSKLIALIAAEAPLGDAFSIYTELNSFYSFNDKPTIEIWPGISWALNDKLVISAACGFSPTFDKITPGISAYFDLHPE